MKLIDLFCGAGGASMGYHQAGFDVIGVDIAYQPHYPFKFVETDWESGLWGIAENYIIEGIPFAVHASPPCQRFSTMTKRWGREESHPDLIADVRKVLYEMGVPYIIENVPSAPLMRPIILCGSMFGLGVRRHRAFETNFFLHQPEHRHKEQGKVVGVYGHAGGSSTRDGLVFAGTDAWREAMNIDWMTGNELAESIPPAYTEYVGRSIPVSARIESEPALS